MRSMALALYRCTSTGRGWKLDLATAFGALRECAVFCQKSHLPMIRVGYPSTAVPLVRFHAKGSKP
jgi:hypothetical protein